MMRKLALCLIVLGLASNARAQPMPNVVHYFTGQDLYDWFHAEDRVDRRQVTDSTDFQLSARLRGYVAGVSDTAATGGLVCLPPRTTVGQLVAVVGKYVTDNPDKWEKTGDWIVINALARAFPCPKR